MIRNQPNVENPSSSIPALQFPLRTRTRSEDSLSSIGSSTENPNIISVNSGGDGGVGTSSNAKDLSDQNARIPAAEPKISFDHEEEAVEIEHDLIHIDNYDDGLRKSTDAGVDGSGGYLYHLKTSPSVDEEEYEDDDGSECDSVDTPRYLATNNSTEVDYQFTDEGDGNQPVGQENDEEEEVDMDMDTFLMSVTTDGEKSAVDADPTSSVRKNQAVIPATPETLPETPASCYTTNESPSFPSSSSSSSSSSSNSKDQTATEETDLSTPYHHDLSKQDPSITAPSPHIHYVSMLTVQEDNARSSPSFLLEGKKPVPTDTEADDVTEPCTPTTSSHKGECQEDDYDESSSSSSPSSPSIKMGMPTSMIITTTNTPIAPKEQNPPPPPAQGNRRHLIESLRDVAQTPTPKKDHPNKSQFMTSLMNVADSPDVPISLLDEFEVEDSDVEDDDIISSLAPFSPQTEKTTVVMEKKEGLSLPAIEHVDDDNEDVVDDLSVSDSTASPLLVVENETSEVVTEKEAFLPTTESGDDDDSVPDTTTAPLPVEEQSETALSVQDNLNEAKTDAEEEEKVCEVTVRSIIENLEQQPVAVIVESIEEKVKTSDIEVPSPTLVQKDSKDQPKPEELLVELDEKSPKLSDKSEDLTSDVIEKSSITESKESMYDILNEEVIPQDNSEPESPTKPTEEINATLSDVEGKLPTVESSDQESLSTVNKTPSESESNCESNVATIQESKDKAVVKEQAAHENEDYPNFEKYATNVASLDSNRASSTHINQDEGSLSEDDNKSTFSSPSFDDSSVSSLGSNSVMSSFPSQSLDRTPIVDTILQDFDRITNDLIKDSECGDSIGDLDLWSSCSRSDFGSIASEQQRRRPRLDPGRSYASLDMETRTPFSSKLSYVPTPELISSPFKDVPQSISSVRKIDPPKIDSRKGKRVGRTRWATKSRLLMEQKRKAKQSVDPKLLEHFEEMKSEVERKEGEELEKQRSLRPRKAQKDKTKSSRKKKAFDFRKTGDWFANFDPFGEHEEDKSDNEAFTSLLETKKKGGKEQIESKRRLYFFSVSSKAKKNSKNSKNSLNESMESTASDKSARKRKLGLGRKALKGIKNSVRRSKRSRKKDENSLGVENNDESKKQSKLKSKSRSFRRRKDKRDKTKGNPGTPSMGVADDLSAISGCDAPRDNREEGSFSEDESASSVISRQSYGELSIKSGSEPSDDDLSQPEDTNYLALL